YDVQLDERDAESESWNIVERLPHSCNPNQAEAVAPDEAGLIAYDLAKGADRAHNDAGVKEVPVQKISGTLWNDADHDGLMGDDEDGLAGKRVLLKAWRFDGQAWHRAEDADASVLTQAGAGGGAVSAGAGFFEFAGLPTLLPG